MDTLDIIIYFFTSKECVKPDGSMGQKPGKHVKKGRQKIPSHVEDSDDEIDSAPVTHSDKHVKTKDQKKMPFFRKQSETCKKRLDHQQYLVSRNQRSDKEAYTALFPTISFLSSNHTL